jgi:hypothetical protein
MFDLLVALAYLMVGSHYLYLAPQVRQLASKNPHFCPPSPSVYAGFRPSF